MHLDRLPVLSVFSQVDGEFLDVQEQTLCFCLQQLEQLFQFYHALGFILHQDSCFCCLSDYITHIPNMDLKQSHNHKTCFQKGVPCFQSDLKVFISFVTTVFFNITVSLGCAIFRVKEEARQTASGVLGCDSMLSGRSYQYF